MNNEATEQKSLGQIAYERYMDGLGRGHWPSVKDSHAVWESVGSVIEAAVLARKPQTVATRELSDSDILDHWDALRSTFGGACPFGSSNQLAETAREMVAKFARHFASRPAAPTYYETATRPPTAEDANEFGMVLAIGSRYKDGWTDKDFRDVSDLTEGWTHWMPMLPAPIPPVSAEDAAFEAAWKVARVSQACEADKTTARKIWDAARATKPA